MGKAMKSVQIARKVTRPNTREFIDAIFEDFIEFHGDRYFMDDGAIVGGIATFKGPGAAKDAAGIPVTVIGVQKGHTLDENIACNFGQPSPEGYRKALRLMKQAEKFHRPIITLVNTSGAYPGLGAEERGQGEAIARNLYEMSDIKTPIICIFTGEGGSGGALALAVADRIWMLEHGMYAILSPEGFASILWRDASRVQEAADLMKLTAGDLLKNSVIEKMIPEPTEGLENNLAFATDLIREELEKELAALMEKSDEELLQERYERFRKFGEYQG